MQIWKPRVLLAFCAAGLLLVGILVYRNSPTGSDFSAYYIAGLRLQAGQGLYEQNNADNLYVYPPLFALLVLPLSFLPLASAASVWYLFGLFCLGWTLRILKQDLFSHVSSNSLFTPACLLALVFCSRFLINHLIRGQSNLLLLALIAWGTHLALRGRLWGSAMAIALAGTLKPFTLLAALPLWSRNRSVWILLLVLFLAFFNLIPALLFGFSGNLQLLDTWSRDYALPSLKARIPLSHEPLDFMNQSLIATCYRLVTPAKATDTGPINLLNLSSSHAALVALAVAVLVGLVGIFKILRIDVHKPDGLIHAQALSVVLMVLLPPLSWKANYVFLLYPSLLLFRHLLSRRQITGYLGNEALLLGIAFFSGSLLLIFPGARGQIIQAYGAVTLCGLLVGWILIRMGIPSPET